MMVPTAANTVVTPVINPTKYGVKRVRKRDGIQTSTGYTPDTYILAILLD
jgi:hypothetical protein